MTTAEKIVRARRLAREWTAENGAPALVERRLTRALLDWLTRHDDIAPADVETIAREIVARVAHRSRVAEDMVADWRAGIPSASSARLARRAAI